MRLVLYYEKSFFFLGQCNVCKSFFSFSNKTRDICGTCLYNKLSKYHKTKTKFVNVFSVVFNRFILKTHVENEEDFYNFCKRIEPKVYHVIAGKKTVYKSIKFSLPIMLKLFIKTENGISSMIRVEEENIYNQLIELISKEGITIPKRSDMICKFIKSFSKQLGGIGLYKTPTKLYTQYNIDFPKNNEKVIAITYLYYYMKRIRFMKNINLKLMKLLCGTTHFVLLEKKLNKQIKQKFDFVG